MVLWGGCVRPVLSARSCQHGCVYPFYKDKITAAKDCLSLFSKTRILLVLFLACLYHDTAVTHQPTLDGGGVHMPIHSMDVYAMGKLLERVYPEGIPAGLER